MFFQDVITNKREKKKHLIERNNKNIRINEIRPVINSDYSDFIFPQIVHNKNAMKIRRLSKQPKSFMCKK